MRSQEGGNAECIQTVGFHLHCSSFGATLGEPTVGMTLWAFWRKRTVWCGLGREDSSNHHEIRMTGGMNDNGSALQR
jgi:hypothetical protein